MTKENKAKKTVPVKEYGKEAFVDAAGSSKERLIYSVVLEDGKAYTKDEAFGLVEAWKKKEVNL